MLRILVLAFFLSVSCSCALKVTNEKLLFHLRKCTYTDQHADASELDRKTPIYATTELVRKFQRNVGLHVTGFPDAETIKAIVTSKCEGGEILVPEGQKRTKRFVLQGSRWYRKDLKYKFMSYPINLKKEDAEKAMRDVFDEWSNYTDLTFTRTDNVNEADIKVEFVSRYHKDDAPFDGPDTVLAHGFYPNYGGDIHFDKEEKWSVDDKPKKGVNLFHVALHEIGHSLGLDHSPDRKAVMYAYEIEGLTDFHLKQDDIKAIQALYGPKTPSTISSTEYLCKDPNIDAALSGRDGKVYLLKNQYYWEFDLHSGDSLGSRPKLIQDNWPGLPGNIDAAFTDNLGRTFFFRKTRYYCYRGKQPEFEEPRKIKSGFPKIPTYIDAALSKPGAVNELHFFKNGKFYKYVRARSPHVDKGYPKNITDTWEDVPMHLDAALRVNDTTYFFKGTHYYSIRDKDAEGATARLKATKHPWIDCQ